MRIHLEVSQYLFRQRHWNSFSQLVKAAVDAVASALFDDFVRDWSSL